YSLSGSLHVSHHPSFPTRRSSDLAVINDAAPGAGRPLEEKEKPEATPPEPATLQKESKDSEVLSPAVRRIIDEEKLDPATISGSDRKSTRLNSSHLGISYAVFCLK